MGDDILGNLCKHNPFLTYRYDLSNISNGVDLSEVEVMKEEKWPSYENTKLNESQHKAFMNAITSEFTVIQVN